MAEVLVLYVSSPELFFLVVLAFLLLIGMIVEGNISIIILTPLFMPMLAQYGIDPVHFGIFFVLAIAIGTLTPPLVQLCLPHVQSQRQKWKILLLLAFHF